METRNCTSTCIIDVFDLNSLISIKPTPRIRIISQGALTLVLDGIIPDLRDNFSLTYFESFSRYERCHWLTKTILKSAKKKTPYIRLINLLVFCTCRMVLSYRSAFPFPACILSLCHSLHASLSTSSKPSALINLKRYIFRGSTAQNSKPI